MAKKVKPCPAWLATFADLMSLLMALFVLLFAMSSVDSKKYESAVESMTAALGHGQDLTQSQVQYFKKSKDNTVDSSKTGDTVLDELKPLYESLIETYAQQNNPSVKINYDPKKHQIKVTFSEAISFPSGQARLKPELIFYLRKLKVYMQKDLFVKAIGHTDSQPIASGGRYGSNWALSSARAAAVIQRLIKDHIIEARQAEAVGVADTQPIDTAKTPEAYAKNRRVEIILMPISLRD